MTASVGAAKHEHNRDRLVDQGRLVTCKIGGTHVKKRTTLVVVERAPVER